MKKTTIGRHAVVLAVSLAGVLNTRLLADAYTRVVVVERGESRLDLAL